MSCRAQGLCLSLEADLLRLASKWEAESHSVRIQCKQNATEGPVYAEIFKKKITGYPSGPGALLFCMLFIGQVISSCVNGESSSLATSEFIREI